MSVLLKKQFMIIALIVLTATTVIVLAVLFVILPKLNASGQEEYTPPPFETNACIGEPDVPEGADYPMLNAQGVFTVGLLPELTVNNCKADAYFYNPPANTLWLLFELVSEDGSTVLYRSGILKPGEYIKTVDLKGMEDFKEKQKATINVYAFEPDTYMSGGKVSVGVELTKE